MPGRTRSLVESLVREHGVAGVRYVLVGLSGYALSLAVFAVLVGAGVSPYAAVPPGFIANGAWNFVLNRLWSFPGTRNPWHRDLGRFTIVALATLAANYLLLALLHGMLGLP